MFEKLEANKKKLGDIQNETMQQKLEAGRE